MAGPPTYLAGHFIGLALLDTPGLQSLLLDSTTQQRFYGIDLAPLLQPGLLVQGHLFAVALQAFLRTIDGFFQRMEKATVVRERRRAHAFLEQLLLQVLAVLLLILVKRAQLVDHLLLGVTALRQGACRDVPRFAGELDQQVKRLISHP